MNNCYFKFFDCLVVTKGIKRSLIIDTQRNLYKSIPTSMTEIIDLFLAKKSIGEILKMYSSKDDSKIIHEYIDYLIENEFGIITSKNEFDNFIEYDKKYNISSIISNAIIEISDITIGKLNNILQNFENFNCNHIQIIGYDDTDTSILAKILEGLDFFYFTSVEILLKYSDDTINYLKSLETISPSVTKIILHTAIDFNLEEITNDIIKKKLVFEKSKIKSFNNCGNVNLEYINVINRDKILESLNHNSCLNKKIAIDKNGYIKNCPALSTSFGNIKDITLTEASKNLNFKKYWNITKDQIEGCKDCEFRHICTDCRALLEDPTNQYSKPLKCGYDPHTNAWEEWSQNPLKQKAIEYYKIEFD